MTQLSLRSEKIPHWPFWSNPIHRLLFAVIHVQGHDAGDLGAVESLHAIGDTMAPLMEIRTPSIMVLRLATQMPAVMAPRRVTKMLSVMVRRRAIPTPSTMALLPGTSMPLDLVSIHPHMPSSKKVGWRSKTRQPWMKKVFSSCGSWMSWLRWLAGNWIFPAILRSPVLSPLFSGGWKASAVLAVSVMPG